MSDACSARGGFDSHAFPPVFRALLSIGLALAYALAAAPAPAWAAQADSTAAHAAPASRDTARAPTLAPTPATPRDSLRAGPAVGGARLTAAPIDTIASARADTSGARTRRALYQDPTGFDRPRWVMFRSLVLPGWGQLHNHAWFKAAVIGGTEWTLIARLVDDRRALDRLSDEIDASRLAGDAALEASLTAEFNARSDRFVGRQWWLGALLAYSLLDAYIDAHFRHFRIDLKDDPALPKEDRGAAGLRLSWQERF